MMIKLECLTVPCVDSAALLLNNLEHLLKILKFGKGFFLNSVLLWSLLRLKSLVRLDVKLAFFVIIVNLLR